MTIWKQVFLVVFFFFAIIFAVDVGRYLFYPDVAYLKKHDPEKTAFMGYREKTWQQKKLKKKIVKIWVPISEVSPYVMKAVIIAEDRKFWSHEGFDFEAIQKALEKDIKISKIQAGGSTISQQLAKNLYLSQDKDPIRKLKEAILTWRIENQLNKRRILELYLNVVEWGDGVFGIEAAAQNYYGKHAFQLTARQAARLASILPNPRHYKLNGESKYVEDQSERIYQLMVLQGVVIPEYDEVIREKNGNNH